MAAATKSPPPQQQATSPPPSANGGNLPAKVDTPPSLVPASQAINLRNLLESQMKRMEKVIPKHLTPERMLRVTLTAVQKTPALWDCTAGSIVGCVTQASQLGLDLDPALGHAYMVPFNNKNTKQREAQLIPGYKGLIALARRSGTVGLMYAHVVYDGDEFDFDYGLDLKLHHKPISEHRGEILFARYVYAVVTFPGCGEKDFEVMSRDEVFKIKARSKAAGSGPWVTDEPEMWRKTVIRRLAKRCPLSPEFMQALTLNDEHEFPVVEQSGPGSALPVGRLDLRAPAPQSAHPVVDAEPDQPPAPQGQADDAAQETLSEADLKRINEQEAAQHAGGGMFNEAGPYGEKA